MTSIAVIVIRCTDYLAYGTIFTRAMFRPNIKLDVFFRQKSRRWMLGGGGRAAFLHRCCCWCTLDTPSTSHGKCCLSELGLTFQPFGTLPRKVPTPVDTCFVIILTCSVTGDWAPSEWQNIPSRAMPNCQNTGGSGVAPGSAGIPVAHCGLFAILVTQQNTLFWICYRGINTPFQKPMTKTNNWRNITCATPGFSLISSLWQTPGEGRRTGLLFRKAPSCLQMCLIQTPYVLPESTKLPLHQHGF